MFYVSIEQLIAIRLQKKSIVFHISLFVNVACTLECFVQSALCSCRTHTHLTLWVTHICTSKLGQHWFRWWLVACSAPSRHLNQCWHFDNLIPGNIFTGDPLHSQAIAHSRAPLFTQPCPHCSHSRAPGKQWARLCVFTLQGCVQAARLCRGSPVYFVNLE